MWRQRFERSANRDDTQYRRGAVLGLTFGEVFLLLAFVLLLLLGLFETQRREDREDLDALRPFEPAADAAAEKGIGPEDLKNLIESLTADDLADPAKLAGYGRAIASAREQGIAPIGIDKVLSAISDRSPEDIDFVRSDLEAGERIRKMAPGVVPSEVSDWLLLEPEKRDLALEIARGADESAIDRIREVLGRDVALRDDVTDAVNQALGKLVNKMGGSIDDRSGSISLPDDVLFAPGSDLLTDETRAFLTDFCGPWIRSIHRFGERIAELRIEGHASSEWVGAPSPDTAYLNNLDLSQRRSAAVLQFCLSQPMSAQAAQWARKKLVAVGLSSSRPVLSYGREDRVRSRRVVFGFETDKQQLLEDIEANIAGQGASAPPADEALPPRPPSRVEAKPALPLPPQPQVEPTPAPILPSYSGPARVIEAGVISVAGTELRLSGIEAPDLGATCSANNGTPMPCGRIAAMRLAEWLDGADVECASVKQLRDPGGRPLAHCRRGAEDLASWLIEAGHAVTQESIRN